MTALVRLRVLAASTALLLVPPCETRAQSAADSFSTPVHRAPGPAGGDPDVLLASGADYKVEFDGGFTFYPYLGPDYEDNLPLRWRTAAVTVGGRPVAGASGAPPRRASDHRVEFDHGGWIEAYSVRRDGVEQTFIFPFRLQGVGDLEVIGHLDTRLDAEPVAAACQELLFRGPRGRALVRYGEATAFDATGRRVTVTTAWDGEEVRLRIDGGFLAGAVYPVTLDPLISRVALENASGAVAGLDIVRDSAGGTGGMFAVYSRVFAANDLDAYGRTTDPDFNNGSLVFTDISPSWSTKEGQCAYVADAQRWVATFERELFSPPVSNIVVYMHDRGDTTINSGTLLTLSRPAGSTARNPDVGGRRAGGSVNALVVYQIDFTTTQVNTDFTEIYGTLVDTQAGVEGTTTDLGWFPSGTTYDREEPAVVKMSDGAFTHWMVVWHEWYRPAVPGDDWDINLTRITFDGRRTAKNYRLGLGGHPWHKRYPRIEGNNGRFLVVYTRGSTSSAPTSEEIRTQRIDWPDTVSDAVLGPPTFLVSDVTRPDFAFPRIAFDDQTGSHWTVSYQRGAPSPGVLFTARVGYRGGVVESRTVFSSSTASGTGTAVAFGPQGGGTFAVFYATTETGHPLLGRELTYAPGAQNLAYGVGCGGLIAASTPHAGSEFFSVALSGAQPGALSVLAVSFASAAISLSEIGMTGCFLNVAAPPVWLPTMADANGRASVTLALPDGPGSALDVFFQWGHVDVSANPAGVVATQGLQSQVR